MEFKILGPLTVRHADTPVPVTAAKEAALLVRLILADGRVVPAADLIEDLWDGAPPDTAETALRVHISRLRRAFEAAAGRRLIETSAPGYRLELDDRDGVDAHRFERLVAEARACAARGIHEQASALFEEALGLWRGAALEGRTDLAFARAAAARLDEQRLVAIEEQADADLALGADRQVAERLAPICEANQARERLWAKRMLALYRAGLQADALEAYQRLREHLLEELGLDPSPEIAALHRAILQQSPELDPPGVLDASSPHNLPFPADAFVGRDQEMTQVRDAINEHRLVTLTGPGGSGKTRLATETALTLLERFTDGVWMVELAPVDDPAAVTRRIASVVGAREERGRPLLETLLDHLSDRDVLLVIDNCEHVVEQVAATCRVILQRCSRVRVLATSREPLRIAGEAVSSVAPLGVPPAAAATLDEAVRHPSASLFVERARAADAHFDASANVPAIVEICRRVEGMPLAIELVAARARTIGLAALAANMTDLLKVLGSGSRRGDPRHRTMRDTVGWSFELLEEPERRLFRRLSVFHGGCTLESAARVCAGDGLEEPEVMDRLASLVDKSLLSVTHAAMSARYHMLVAIRDFAADQLQASGEADRTLEARMAWMLDLAEDVEGKIWQGDQDAIGKIAQEHDNLIASLEWAIADDRHADEAARLTIALHPYLDRRGHLRDLRTYLERATELACAPVLRGAILRALAGTLIEQGEFDRGRALAQEAIAIAREHNDEKLGFMAMINLGNASKNTGDYELARTTLTEALEVAERMGDRHSVRLAISNLAPALAETGDLTGAVALIERSLAAARALGDSKGAASDLANLGVIAWRQGDTDRAGAFWTEALEIAEELEDAYFRMTLLSNLGSVDQRRGNLARARERYEASQDLAFRLGSTRHIANAVVNVGTLEFQSGRYVKATVTLERALAVTREAGDELGSVDPRLLLAACRIAMGDLETAAAHLSDVLALSRARGYLRGELAGVLGLGDVARARGDLDGASVAYAEALELAERGIDEELHAAVLRSRAWLELERGDANRARSSALRSLELLAGTEDSFAIARTLIVLGVTAADIPVLGAAALELAAGMLERIGAVAPSPEAAGAEDARGTLPAPSARIPGEGSPAADVLPRELVASVLALAAEHLDGP